MTTRQNTSVVIDGCQLYEDGLHVVAARRHSVVWYSRDNVLTPVRVVYIVAPFVSGAVVADGIFAYRSDDSAGAAQCVYVRRDDGRVWAAEPVECQDVPPDYSYIGCDKQYASWGYWASAKGSVVTADMGDVIISGAGRRVVLGTAEGGILARDVAGGDCTPIADGCEPPISVWWLAGGAIACATASALYVCSADGGVATLGGAFESVWDSPDGIVAVDRDGAVWRATDGENMGTKYESYEWIWYNGRHGDWIGLDVSGRAVAITSL